MTNQEAEILIKAIRGLSQPAADNGARRVLAQSPNGQKLVAGVATVESNLGPIPISHGPAATDTPLSWGGVLSSPEQFEQLYRHIKKRLLEDFELDPTFLQVMSTRPQINIHVTPREVTVDGSTLRGRLARLIGAGFLDTPVRQGTVRTEMKRTGTEPDGGSLSRLFAEFVKEGFLTRDGDEYQKAPGLKVTETVLTVT